jgi:hypothetical protein
MYPNSLYPSEIEIFVINNETIEIPKCTVKFEKWNGEPLKNTFGGKAVVAINGKPMFAELAVMNLFLKEAWQSRWIETYGRGNMDPFFLTEWKDDKYINQINVPIKDSKILNLLDSIAKENGNTFAGCWDVFAWKDDRVVFSEIKRFKKDSIRSTQTKWLESALKCGLSEKNFLIVQWDF